MNVSTFDLNNLKKHGFFTLPQHHSFFLKGEEVRRWCNGMFSNNIRSLKPHKGNRSGICNPKGHVQGLLDVYCIDDNCFLVVLDGLSEDDFTKRFAPFMMLDDIELEPFSDRIVSLQGENADEILTKMGWTIDTERDIMKIDEGFVVRNDRFGSRRHSHGFDLITKDTSSFEKLLSEDSMIISAQLHCSAILSIAIINLVCSSIRFQY